VHLRSFRLIRCLNYYGVLSMRFATDKVQLGYLPSYLKLAAEIGIHGHVCEVGVYRGGSLEMWQALFPKGVVVGVDDETDSVLPYVQDVVVMRAAQDDPALPSKLKPFAPFDLIVDDASHQGALSRRTWELLWPLVAPGGYYVMEDWQVAFWGGAWDESMLRTAESFLRELHSPTGVMESIEYRHGRVIMHKRRGA
jgi:hypothetical protein